LDELHPDHPADKCRQAVLQLAMATREAWWEYQSSSDLSIRGSPTNFAEQRLAIRTEILTKLCDRAIAVTQGIAHAADQAAILRSRSEFERLYWAELYWVELGRREQHIDRKKSA
jgi:hypothetical protein